MLRTRRPERATYLSDYDDSEDSEEDINFPRWSTQNNWEDETVPRQIFPGHQDQTGDFMSHASRTQIAKTDIHTLRPGDHIGWRRPWLIWHHQIVEKIDSKNGMLLVNHFTSRDGTKGKIIREWIDVTEEKGELFRFEYDEEVKAQNTPKQILERAHQRRNETGYNLLTNNCEHFATECKTGKPYSNQVTWALERVKQSFSTVFGSVAYVLSKMNPSKITIETVELITRKVWNMTTINGNSFGYLHVKTILSDITTRSITRSVSLPSGTKIYQSIVGSISKLAVTDIFMKPAETELWKGVSNIMMNNIPAGFMDMSLGIITEHTEVLKITTSETVEHACKGTNWVGAGLVCAAEAFHCGRDIYRIHQRYKSGDISKRDFKITTTERVSEGVSGAGLAVGGSLVGEAVGGTIGGAIGSVIPVVGTAAGAVGGSFLGSVAGGWLGSCVGKGIGRLCGRWLGNFLW